MSKKGDWINDAGHGGSDPGAVAKGNVEKVYTLEATLYIDKRLDELGINNSTTRTTDVTLSNSNRTAKMRKHKKGISSHFNAGGGSGVEVIHSIHSNGKFEHMIIEEFKKAGYPVRPRPVFFKKNSSGDDFYFMHRNTGNCRVTIVEYDFVDGPQSEKIKNKAYREGMYECVIKAICRDEGVAYKAPKGSTPAPKPTPSKPKEANDLLETAVVYNSLADISVAEGLASKLQTVTVQRTVAEKKKVAKTLYVVGGTKDKLKADKFVVISGANRYRTADLVGKHMGV